MRKFVGILLFLAGAACTSTNATYASDRIRLVSSLGVPISGAVLTPEQETIAGVSQFYSDRELKHMTTDSQGEVRIHLEAYLWSDGSYRFHVAKAGFKDSVLAKSRDQFSSVLTIDLTPDKN